MQFMDEPARLVTVEEAIVFSCSPKFGLGQQELLVWEIAEVRDLVDPNYQIGTITPSEPPINATFDDFD
jgi:hypothetical protein